MEKLIQPYNESDLASVHVNRFRVYKPLLSRNETFQAIKEGVRVMPASCYGCMRDSSLRIFKTIRENQKLPYSIVKQSIQTGMFYGYFDKPGYTDKREVNYEADIERLWPEYIRTSTICLGTNGPAETIKILQRDGSYTQEAIPGHFEQEVKVHHISNDTYTRAAIPKKFQGLEGHVLIAHLTKENFDSSYIDNSLMLEIDEKALIPVKNEEFIRSLAVHHAIHVGKNMISLICYYVPMYGCGSGRVTSYDGTAIVLESE